MHLNFSCPAVSQLCGGRDRKGNRGGTLSNYSGLSQQASGTMGSRLKGPSQLRGVQEVPAASPCPPTPYESFSGCPAGKFPGWTHHAQGDGAWLSPAWMEL